MEKGNHCYWQRGTPIPKVYPPATQWQELEEEIRELYHEACAAEVVAGLIRKGDELRLEPVFFFSHEAHRAFVTHLKELQREHIKYIPFFQTPTWAPGSRHMKKGLTRQQVKEMVTIYMVEAEACLLEIVTYSSPRLKEDLFVYQWDIIYNV